MRVVVLAGGSSEERDVSLASGTQVARALETAGHEVLCLDTARGLLSRGEIDRIIAEGIAREAPSPAEAERLRSREWRALTTDPTLSAGGIVFPALHGGAGEDGTLQALLGLRGIPFAGSGRLGCSLAMDKEVTKQLLRWAGIPTPDWLMGDPAPAEVEAALGFPVIVKPAAGGSTLGLTLVEEPGGLERAVETARRYEDRVLFERYVRGRELTVGILGAEALPVGEIIAAHTLFDYECKYQPGLAEEIFPADIPDGLAGRLSELALRVHGLLHLRDFSRVDFIVDGEGRPWCLEANALPGLASASLVPKAAAAAGFDFPAFCDRIVSLAAERAARRGTRPPLPGS